MKRDRKRTHSGRRAHVKFTPLDLLFQHGLPQLKRSDGNSEEADTFEDGAKAGSYRSHRIDGRPYLQSREAEQYESAGREHQNEHHVTAYENPICKLHRYAFAYYRYSAFVAQRCVIFRS
jgi:hypothetical protein